MSRPRTPPSQTSVLQRCERTHFCCFQSPMLRGFVTTAPGSFPSAGGAHRRSPLCSSTCHTWRPNSGVRLGGYSEGLCFLSLGLRPGGANGPLTAGTNTDKRAQMFCKSKYEIQTYKNLGCRSLIKDDSFLYKQLLLNRKSLGPFQVPADSYLLFPMQLPHSGRLPLTVFLPGVPLAEQLDPNP